MKIEKMKESNENKEDVVTEVLVERKDLKPEFRDIPLHEIEMEHLESDLVDLLRMYAEFPIVIKDGEESWKKKTINSENFM